MQATIKNVGADSRRFVAAALLLVAVVFVVALLAFTGHQATPARTLFSSGTQAQSGPAGGQSTEGCTRGCHGALP